MMTRVMIRVRMRVRVCVCVRVMVMVLGAMVWALAETLAAHSGNGWGNTYEVP